LKLLLYGRGAESDKALMTDGRKNVWQYFLCDGVGRDRPDIFIRESLCWAWVVKEWEECQRSETCIREKVSCGLRRGMGKRRE